MTEADAVDHYFLSPTENISILWTTGNKLIIVRRCTLGLPVEGYNNQIPQLQFTVTVYAC